MRPARQNGSLLGNLLALLSLKGILGAPDITNANTTLINAQIGPGATNIDMAGIRLTQQEILAIAIALAAGQ